MKKLFVILGLLTGLFMVVGCVKKPAMNFPEKIQYLKEHEEELVDFVKSYKEKDIGSVQFKWHSAEIENVSKGKLRGANHIISLGGSFNQNPESYFFIGIRLDNDGYPDLRRIYFLSEPTYE